MSNHSEIALSESLETALANFLKSSEDRALLFCFKGQDDTICYLDKTIPLGSSVEADIPKIVASLEGKCRYVFMKRGPDDYIFANFIPEDSNVRDKMIYARSSEILRKQLPPHEMYSWTEPEDLREDLAKKVGPDAEPRVPQPNAQRPEDTERPQQQSGAAVGLDLPSEAISALKNIAPGTFVGLIVQGEGLHMRTHACDVFQSSDVPAKFGPEPTYGIWDDQRDHKWLIYRCPDEVGAKERMIAASCRNGVLANIQKHVSIDSTIETADEIEFEIPELESAQQAPEFVGTEVRKMRRPAKPGRVSRR